jgi:HAD superfamily hydrolase (TIGR01509 family)
MTTDPPSTLSAVFFDLDGTLIDSEHVWDDAVRRLATSRSVEADAPLLARTRGMDLISAIHLLHDEFGWPSDGLHADAAWVSERVAETFRTGVIWRPGAQQLLTQLRQAHVPTALVTSSYREMVEIILVSLGPENFDRVVCGDDVRSPKPHPEPYLTAARLLDVDIGKCVAIEDSPMGAASARAAGCAVLLVGDHPADQPDEVDSIRKDLMDVDLATLSALLA